MKAGAPALAIEVRATHPIALSNRSRLLNAMGWLAREETLIEVRGRDPMSQPVILSPTEKKVFGWGSVLGWPILVGSLALGLMLRGRREGPVR